MAVASPPARAVSPNPADTTNAAPPAAVAASISRLEVFDSIEDMAVLPRT
jgi:hypothetical protein